MGLMEFKDGDEEGGEDEGGFIKLTCPNGSRTLLWIDNIIGVKERKKGGCRLKMEGSQLEQVVREPMDQIQAILRKYYPVEHCRKPLTCVSALTRTKN